MGIQHMGIWVSCDECGGEAPHSGHTSLSYIKKTAKTEEKWSFGTRVLCGWCNKRIPVYSQVSTDEQEDTKVLS